MSRREQIYASLRQWIADKSGADPQTIANDTPLVERRLLTSLQVLELLLHIEALRGQPVDATWIQPGTFRDLDTIYQRLFTE